MPKQKKCDGLNNLIQSNQVAKAYFMALPDYVQGMVQQQTHEVTSLESLHECAERLISQYE